VGSVELTSANHIHPFAAFLAASGVPVQPLLRRAGLPATCLDNPTMLLPTAGLWHFRELAATHTGIPGLAVAVMKPLQLREFGAIGRALLRAPTLLRRIRDFGRLSRSESSTATFDLVSFPGANAFFSAHLSLRNQQGQWQAELYILMWMLKIAWLTDATWRPEEIWLTAPATPERLRVMESLTARPLFDRPCVGFRVSTGMLSRPPVAPAASRRPAEIDEAALWSRAPSDSSAGAIKQMVQAYANERWLTLAQASEVLNVNLRTLQRQLAAEGTTFSEIVEEARLEIAGSLLEYTNASLTEISGRLGYSNLSNFNRAFRRWSAISPREFRERRSRH
jgi:AraC-like DNA-binding protein